MDAYRAIVDKRDQRFFLPRPIPEEALRRVLQAARMTGSSKNSEPNRLIVVRERAGLEALAALSPYAKFIARSAATIVIAQTEQHQFDAGRCAQNMMVAAWAEGVSSCPVSMHHVDCARDALALPADHRLAIVVAFGYKAKEQKSVPEAARKPFDEYVSRHRGE